MIAFTKKHKIIQSSEGDITLLKEDPKTGGYTPFYVIEHPTPGVMGLEELIGYGEGIADLLERLPKDVRKKVEV